MEKIADWLYLPVNASSHGGEIDAIIIYVHVLMLVLFIGWGLFFLYSLIRFRKNKNPKADYAGVRSHTSSYIEVAVVIAEIVLLVFFSIPLWAKVYEKLPAEEESTLVRVVAQQFAWNVQYPGADGVFGRVDSTLIDEQSNPLGLDHTDPHAADDILTVNQLNLPINKPALIRLSSKDVIHSFFLPEMRVKQDMIPGMEIPIAFTPVKMAPEGAQWEIACAQLCGLGHYRMRGFLNIQTKETFDRWMAEETALKLEEGSGGDDFWD